MKANNSLLEVDFSNNHFSLPILESFSRAIAQHKTLQKVYIHSNTLKKEYREYSLLASAYAENVYLQSLVLNTEVMTTKSLMNRSFLCFPPTILEMTHLKILDLSGNLITEIPPAILKLTCLVDLNLKNNHISSLPIFLIQLSNLKYLGVDGNPLKTPPKEVTKKGLRAILGYLKDLDQGSIQVYRTKLMIVGQENVGKTTIIKSRLFSSIDSDFLLFAYLS